MQGESLLTRQQILAAADVPTAPTSSSSTSVRSGRGSGPWRPYDASTCSRDWPHGVLIKVTERTPVAVVEIGGRFHAMDAEGVLFRDYPRPPAGMPRVVSTEGTSSAALAEAARVIAALPPGLAGRVDHVAVAGRRPGLAGDARRCRGDLGERRPVRPSRPRCSSSLLAPAGPHLRRQRPRPAGHQRPLSRPPRAVEPDLRSDRAVDHPRGPGRRRRGRGVSAPIRRAGCLTSSPTRG